MSGVLTVNDFSVKKLRTLGLTEDEIANISDLPSLRTLNMDLMAFVLPYCIRNGIFDDRTRVPGVNNLAAKLKDNSEIKTAYNQYITLTKSSNIKYDAFCKDFLRYIWVCYIHVASQRSIDNIIFTDSIV